MDPTFGQKAAAPAKVAVHRHLGTLAAQSREGGVDPVGVRQARPRVGRVVFGLRMLLLHGRDRPFEVGEHLVEALARGVQSHAHLRHAVRRE